MESFGLLLKATHLLHSVSYELHGPIGDILPLGCELGQRIEGGLVLTEEKFPSDWAVTLYNMGFLWRNINFVERKEGLRRSIACHEAALRVMTPEAFPQQHQAIIAALHDEG